MYSIRIKIVSLTILCWCSLGGGTALNRTIRQAFCTGSQFTCSRGGCVDKSEVCNGLNHCADGSDESPDACDCGNQIRRTASSPGLHEASYDSQPWHAGIYRVRHNNHHTLICSGTLIYDDIVLTSANCVIDPDTHLTYAATSIRISTGKLKRDFNVDEPGQQKFEVRKIVKMDRYEGDTKGYARNLAIIKLKLSIRKTNQVRPICLWPHKRFVQGAGKATITGWGLQSTGNYALNLKEAQINPMDVGDCVHKFYDPLYKRFLTNDKFCFTFDHGIGLKEDDTGGPVVINEGRSYLMGLISVQLPDSDFGIATKISKHLDWIKKTVFELKEADNCLLGSHFNCNSNSKCIKMNMVCDGKRDCVDGSDENSSLCTLKAPSSGGNGNTCIIPEGYEIFKVLKCSDPSGCKSKRIAFTSSKYQITCPEGRGFAKLGVEAVQTVCNDGEWIPDLSEIKCLQLCPAQEYKTLELNCLYRGNSVKCNEPMRPNTIITVSCKRQFKKQALVNYANKTTCRRDGSLLHDITTECTPVCGVPFNHDAQALISNGQKVKYAKYPWHAGIYWKEEIDDGEFIFKYQCGGTLIDTNKILTAGHCIWEAGRNDIKDPSSIGVTLGKYYSSWTRKEELEKKVGVYKVIPGRHYNGASTKYSQDIAVLILNQDVKLSDYIMPACLDLNGTAGGIPVNQSGHIVGWGRLHGDDSDHSPELMETTMDYLDLDTCRKRFSSYSFSEYLQTDKFCVLYRNGSGTQTGDSGGGLTFTHDYLHYVYGVVSLKKPGQDEFAAFTNVLSHSSWLQDIISRY